MKINTNKPMQKTKLLFYIPGLVDGGAERVWALLASYFARAGHDVILAVDFAKGENAPELDARVRVEALGQGHLANVLQLAALLKRERPDVMLSAIGGSNVKALLARAISPARVKTIIAYHGFEEYRSGRLSWLAYAALPLLSRIAVRTIAVSDSLREDLITKWRSSAKRTIRIYNPVDIESINTEISKEVLEARQNLILAVGRLSKEKNISLLIKALSLMADKTARAVILGEGPERASLQDQINNLGLKDRVSMPGYTATPHEWYERAKCLALPSNTESFGMVVVEALAHGLPVIATDCAGPAEILDNGRYGVIVPRGEAKALAKALERALDAPGEPEARRERAALFSAQTGVQNYEKLIEDVLEERSNRS